jgi:hypothetical protein
MAEEATMADRMKDMGPTDSEPGDSDLQRNAKKALQMKREAADQTKVPEHETPREGGVGSGQVGYTDTAIGKEPTYTPNLKRSHNARTGDS